MEIDYHPKWITTERDGAIKCENLYSTLKTAIKISQGIPF